MYLKNVVCKLLLLMLKWHSLHPAIKNYYLQSLASLQILLSQLYTAAKWYLSLRNGVSNMVEKMQKLTSEQASCNNTNLVSTEIVTIFQLLAAQNSRPNPMLCLWHNSQHWAVHFYRQTPEPDAFILLPSIWKSPDNHGNLLGMPQFFFLFQKRGGPQESLTHMLREIE